MEIDKSYVKVLLKKGVSKGSELGWEIECKLVKGDTKEELLELGKQAFNSAKEISEMKLI